MTDFWKKDAERAARVRARNQLRDRAAEGDIQAAAKLAAEIAESLTDIEPTTLPAITEQRGDHPNFKPDGLSQALLTQLADRDPIADARVMSPRRALERESQLRQELAESLAFIASGKILRPLRTHAERLARIQAPHYVNSIRYQRQQWTCEDDRNAAAKAELWDVIAFEARFIRGLRQNSIPAFTAVWSGRSFEVYHCYFFDRLDLGSWNIMAAIGLDIAARMRLKVHWGGKLHNSRCAQWEVDDPDDPRADYRNDLTELIEQKRSDRFKR